MRSTPVHIKDKNELKFIVPFVFHFLKKKSQENQTFFLKGQTNKLTEAMKCLEQTEYFTNGGCTFMWSLCHWS